MSALHSDGIPGQESACTPRAEAISHKLLKDCQKKDEYDGHGVCLGGRYANARGKTGGEEVKVNNKLMPLNTQKK